MNRFQFLFEYNGVRVSVELDGDSNLSDTLDAFETFLIACRFDKDQASQAAQDLREIVAGPSETPGPVHYSGDGRE
jgi:hypothetical protein